MPTELPCVSTHEQDGESKARRPIKVLRISHSGSIPAYRERERQLIKNFPIQLRLIIPEQWEHLGSSDASEPESFEIVMVKTYGTGNIPLFAYDLVAIANQLKEFQPDLIDIHEEPYSVSCIEILCLAKLLVPDAACVFYSAQNIHKRYPFPFSWTEQFVYRNSVGAYPCSSGVQDVLKAKGYATNSTVIPLGVDPNFFKVKKVDRTRLGLRRNSFVLGYFGRLEDCKGIEYILDALQKISSAVDVQMLMVGNGSYETQLKQLASKLDIGDRVVWAGALAMKDVPDYLNCCDIVVVPSVTTATWKEQFGRVVVEAMACGVPVIASDSGSLPEVVGDAGLIVPEQNAEALAEKITLLAKNKDLRKQLRARGLEMVRELYTWQKVAEQTFAFYDRALRLAAKV